MNRGYVRLWRKSLDAGWIQNHKLWAFWTYCLMKASYREFDAIVGLQVVHLIPGQFIFGLHVASKETGLTIREIRTILDFLRNAKNLTIKTTNKFSIITIINWPTYQGEEIENDKLNDKPLANKGQHTNIKEVNLYRENALQVLSYLNEKTGKRYRDPSFIEARLKDGGSVADCRKIIDTKMQDPYFRDNPKYLNPRTLFRPSHWDQYLNESIPVPETKSAPSVHTVACPACGRTVLSSDMAGDVCSLCAEDSAYA